MPRSSRQARPAGPEASRSPIARALRRDTSRGQEGPSAYARSETGSTDPEARRSASSQALARRYFRGPRRSARASARPAPVARSGCSAPAKPAAASSAAVVGPMAARVIAGQEPRAGAQRGDHAPHRRRRREGDGVEVARRQRLAERRERGGGRGDGAVRRRSDHLRARLGEPGQELGPALLRAWHEHPPAAHVRRERGRQRLAPRLGRDEIGRPHEQRSAAARWRRPPPPAAAVPGRPDRDRARLRGRRCARPRWRSRRRSSRRGRGRGAPRRAGRTSSVARARWRAPPAPRPRARAGAPRGASSPPVPRVTATRRPASEGIVLPLSPGLIARLRAPRGE